MAIAATRVQVGTGDGNSEAPAVVLGVAPTSGNLLIAYSALSGQTRTQDANTAAGWIEVSENVSGDTGSMYYKIAGGGESTTQQPAIMDASGAWLCEMVEWHADNGWDIATILSAANSDANATKTFGIALDPPDGVAALIIGAARAATNETWSGQTVNGSTTGVVEQTDAVRGTAVSATMWSRVLASTPAGNQVATATASGANNGGIHLFLIQEAAGGPTVVTGAAALSGTGALAAAASVRVLAAATLAGTGAASATASVQVLAAAALAGTGALSAAGLTRVFGAATLTGVGAASAAALVQVFGAATLAGSGALAASGMTEVRGAATLSSAGSLAASAQVDVLAAAMLTGNGALAAIGDVVTEGVVTGVATLSGTGALTATARVTVLGAGALTGLGALTATGQAQIQGVAALSGLGSLTALARLRVLGAAMLSGVGSLTASGDVLEPVADVPIFTGNADWTLAYDNADSLVPSAIPSEAPEVLVPTVGVPAGTADWTLG